MPKVTLESRTIAARNKWTTVVEEKFLFDDGRLGQYIVVERPAAVTVLPLLKQGNVYCTYMVRQYRYPVGQDVWQFPAGALETGKDLTQQAKDELRQETGLVAGKLTKLRQYFLDPGLSRQYGVFFVAEDLQEGGQQQLEEEEKGMIYKKIPLADLDGMAADGSITDFWGYIGIKLLQDHITIQNTSHD